MVISKLVNGGAGNTLEIPVENRFLGEKRAVLRKETDKNEEAVNNMKHRCLK